MIEFLHNYGLWLVLAGVFIAMNRFGISCCGAGHHRSPPQHEKKLPNEDVTHSKTRDTAHPTGSCN